MKMLHHFLICVFALILFSAFSSPATTSNAQTIDKSTVKVIPTETFASKTSQLEIELSRTILTKACREDKQCERFCSSEGQITKVSVSSTNIKDENLTYKYAVSGGTITGRGASVIWDFRDTSPGYYTVGVEVTDGKNISFKSEKKRITLVRCAVSESANSPACIAPNINVTTQTDSVKAGETIEFTADVSGGSQTSVAYNWSIQSKKRKISDQPTNWKPTEISFEGQSTPNIKIKTTSATAGETLIATVEFLGLCATGPKAASAAVFVDEPHK